MGGERVRIGHDVVVEQHDERVRGVTDAAVAARGGVPGLVLDEPHAVGKVERAHPLGAPVAARVEDDDGLEALRRVGLTGERREHVDEQLPAVVRRDDDRERR